MAAQFLDEKKQPVSKQTLPIRVGKKVVLFLKEDPNASPKMQVGTNDESALKVEEKNGPGKPEAGLRRFEITAIADTDTAVVVASPDDIGLKVNDLVTFLVLNKQEAAEYYRNKIIELAKSKENAGCHYLWGAAGASPDQQNGMPGRRGAVVLFDPAKHKGAAKNDVMHDVAVCQVSGFNTFAGRAMKLSPPGAFIADPRRTLTDEELAKETDDRSWRTVYKSYQGGRKGMILGEKCQDIQHFDCIGLVNYCLSTVFGENIQFEISGTEGRPNTGFANQETLTITNDNDDQPADILIYRGSEKEVDIDNKKGGTYKKKVIIGAGHIAFSLGNGKGRINAIETEFGVISEASIGNPIRRVRYYRLA